MALTALLARLRGVATGLAFGRYAPATSPIAALGAAGPVHASPAPRPRQRTRHGHGIMGLRKGRLAIDLSPMPHSP
jgi:hypothetical protein